MNWTILATAAIACGLVFWAERGDAHSKNEMTKPLDGTVLSDTPDVIGLRFDQPMRVTLISLTDQEGREHPLKRTDDMQPLTEFEAEPPELPTGQYKIEWRGLAADGHPMQGAFHFEIAH